MKKIIILATALISINALAINTEETNKMAIMDKSGLINDMDKHKSKVIDIFNKSNLKTPWTLSSTNPFCVKACEREYNACLDAGYPWNSCNWEFQACADICLTIPNC